MRKEFILMSLFFIVLPIVLVYFSRTIVENIIGIQWENNYNNGVFAGLLLAILGCVYILIRNYALKLHSIFWYAFPTVTGVILLLLLYTVYSLSHFGF